MIHITLYNFTLSAFNTIKLVNQITFFNRQNFVFNICLGTPENDKTKFVGSQIADNSRIFKEEIEFAYIKSTLHELIAKNYQSKSDL